MPLHLAARLHAFWHGLFRPTDQAEARARYEAVSRRLAEHGVLEQKGRATLVELLAERVAGAHGLALEHPRFPQVFAFVAHLMDYESYFVLPEIDWTERRSVSEWWELREALNVQQGYVAQFEDTCALIELVGTELLRAIVEAVPSYLTTADAETDITVETTLLHSLGNLGATLDQLVAIGLADELRERQLFTRLRARLEYNLIAASGGNPADPKSFTRTPLWPSKANIADVTALAESYLAGTPLLGFLGQDLPFVIPTKVRFEHTHIVAGSGHGKTQTLQYLICRDLPAVAKGERSIIVIDSQGDLIKNIAHLAEFAPAGPLHERLVLIDPSDVEWPVSLNLFDVGMERLSGYAPLERERLTNSILELYDFVLGTLLAAEMTQKQSVIFRYVTRLMLHIPDATIHTLRELMEPDGHQRFHSSIEQLSGTARRFFETEFIDREFTQTKKQVLRRLWGILENQTFERMFSHPRSKLDLFAEMNAGKVILINTAKDLLKEQGAQIFGRFFIALIAQAAQERATLPLSQRLPTFVYIDEAADYFDRNISTILEQARKYQVGMVLAHQYLAQLDAKLQDAVAANTSVKLAGGVSTKDARALAPMLHVSPEFIERQGKGCFASYVRGLTAAAVPLSFPLGYLEKQPKLTKGDWQALRQVMRDKYAVPIAALASTGTDGGDEPADESTAAAAPATGPEDDIDTTSGKTW